MKNILSALVIGCALLIPSFHARSQARKNFLAYTNTKNLSKTTVACGYCYCDNSLVAYYSNESATTSGPTVNDRTIKDFKSRFGQASEPAWYFMMDGYIGYFSTANERDRVLYNSNGRWQYTIRDYDESRMPLKIREVVKRAYYDFVITLVEEIESYNGKTYIVLLEDRSSIKTLKVSTDGVIEVMQDMKKV